MAPPISKEVNDQLYDLYYTKQNFFGRDKIYELALTNHIDVSRRQVADWLAKQEVNQLLRRREHASTIIPTVLKNPNSQIAIDLIDFQNHEFKGYKWIFTAIDLFSKKAYAFPMKSKDSNESSKIIEKIIKEIDEHISVIRSDNGSEFTNKNFQKVLNKYDIKQILSSAYTPQSNGGIERFNGSLKQLIFKSLYSNDSKDWVSILPTLVENYNNSKHSTIDDTPNNVSKQSDEDHEKTNEKIKDKVQNLENENVRFQKGDIVRVYLNKAPDKEVGESEKQIWSKTRYKVSKIFRSLNGTSAPYYYITDMNGKDINGKFYNNDLLLANQVENEKVHEKKFIVSKIIEPQVQNGQPGYIVAWKGYLKASDNTWEPRENLIEDVPKLVKKYETQFGYWATNPKTNAHIFRKTLS